MYRLYNFEILVLLSLFKYATGLEKMLGPSDFVFKSMEACSEIEDKGGIEFTMIKKKHNRTMHVYDIGLDTEYDIANDLIIQFNGSLKKEGGYKQGSYLMRHPICDGFHTVLGSVFDDFLQAIGFEDCPITAGSYSIESFYFDNENFDIPQLYGEYKMDFLIYKDEELIRCLRSFYDFVPKQA